MRIGSEEPKESKTLEFGVCVIRKTWPCSDDPFLLPEISVSYIPALKMQRILLLCQELSFVTLN
jgi:hypothetical protein